MAVLADYEIERLVKEQNLIDPYDPKQLQPASYDVVLAKGWKVQRASADRPCEFYDHHQRAEVNHGDFIIASTEETFNLPDNVAATLALKSTIGRMGMSHALACWADPGFRGQMTLELYVVGHSLIELYAGMKIGQMIFQPVVAMEKIIHNSNDIGETITRKGIFPAKSKNPYDGRYQDQKGATLPREEKS